MQRTIKCLAPLLKNISSILKKYGHLKNVCMFQKNVRDNFKIFTHFKQMFVIFQKNEIYF